MLKECPSLHNTDHLSTRKSALPDTATLLSALAELMVRGEALDTYGADHLNQHEAIVPL
jgi:hypothetical protein